jgi:hypothetical protein
MPERVKIQELNPSDNSVGYGGGAVAGSTGRDDSNIIVCRAFFTVEQMRRGVAPADACVETLRCVYAINQRGEFGTGSLYPGHYAAHDRRTAALRESAHLFEKPT